jgi:proteasome lid subunit RPN8/RPN11
MIKRKDLLTDEVDFAIRAHAMSEYPNECIGYVSGGRYHQAKNVHESPTLAARMDPKLILKLVKQKKLQAIVHSHPNGPNCPSEADMKAQLDMAIPFILVSCTETAALPPFAWGDQLEPLPLEGRGFQHGVADCYELIRDEGRPRCIILPPYPRDW